MGRVRSRSTIGRPGLVHREGAAGERLAVEPHGKARGNLRIRCPQRKPFEVPHREHRRRTRLPRPGDPLDHREHAEIVRLSEVGSDDEGAHRSPPHQPASPARRLDHHRESNRPRPAPITQLREEDSDIQSAVNSRRARPSPSRGPTVRVCSSRPAPGPSVRVSGHCGATPRTARRARQMNPPRCAMTLEAHAHHRCGPEESSPGGSRCGFKEFSN
jgi:hypothetical protein